ncbi:MAG TPA: oxygen-dependent coproporphyrinogen oxidase [Trueperaceae bacterium]
MSAPWDSAAARRVVDLVRGAQGEIVARFEGLEERARFRPHTWERQGGGGGTAMVLQDGETFAKVGINVSAVHGAEVPASLAAVHPEAAGKPFFATGLSLIAHAVNPYVPSFHANYRYFEVGDLWWFGGGADLTPNYGFEEDVRYFHGVLKAQCDARDPALYDELKRRCDEYFYLPHRRETRGVGGIFFDQLTPPRELAAAGADGAPGGPLWEADLAFVASGLAAIPEAYLPLVARRRAAPYGEREVAWQRLRRGRYVEFNLVYDRGTLFGLQTGGNIEAILVSLPPLAAWAFDHRPEPGSPEARLAEYLVPRDWLGTRRQETA